ncbi:MAG: pyrimidine reductase family protein [Cryobacterium sp.]|nr:pyrimidine reductase family protein [Cryobacterium sp.]
MADHPDRARIDRLWPRVGADLDDAALVADLSSDSPVLRVNFVASVDGSATQEGRSGGLSDDADKRYFELLRRVSDVVLVGAGTVRTEGYGALRVSDDSVRWRVEHGLSEHPVFAIVSRSLDLDPAIVAEAPVRPILFTIQDALIPAALAAADVVVAGVERVEGGRILAALAERGLETVLCEGGPHLFASLLDDDVVDELCLTVSPVLEGGDGMRITSGLAERRGLEPVSILRSNSTLLLRYRRARDRGY